MRKLKIMAVCLLLLSTFFTFTAEANYKIVTDTQCYYGSQWAAQQAMNAQIGAIVMSGGVVSNSGTFYTGPQGGETGGSLYCYSISYTSSPIPHN